MEQEPLIAAGIAVVAVAQMLREEGGGREERNAIATSDSPERNKGR